VKSVDTRLFYEGRQGFCYSENAESFLQIGDALGHAMLDLLQAESKK